MRLDHIAYRTNNRHKTVDFFVKAFHYKVQTEFDIQFPDGSSAKCFALEPPEKLPDLPWTLPSHNTLFHLAPEIFVSDGSDGSIVSDWVKQRNGIGGIHHLAYQVDNVHQTVQEWKDKGFAEFSSDQPLTCPDLTQIFTKPSLLTGVIYEFIERGKHGFCKDNVRDLMQSTKNADAELKVRIDHLLTTNITQ